MVVLHCRHSCLQANPTGMPAFKMQQAMVINLLPYILPQGLARLKVVSHTCLARRLCMSLLRSSCLQSWTAAILLGGGVTTDGAPVGGIWKFKLLQGFGQARDALHALAHGSPA